MHVRVNEDVSPCVAKDPATGIGVVLLPGDYVDFDELGIDGAGFVKAHRWAFEVVEEATAKPGQKRTTNRSTAS